MKSAKKTPARLPKTPRSRVNSAHNLTKDPVQVYCRVRPLQADADATCLRVDSPTTVTLTPPELAINYKIGTLKETQYVFKHVFASASKQNELYATVAQPLVESLIRGRNGLLFTYGVTGSGKTYTMTGDVQNRGIMPRCLDSLFRTISDYQTKKFVFKPDRMNGFEILSEVDACAERQAEMYSRFNKNRRKDSDPEIASKASNEASLLCGVDEDNMFAVFVTYIEVYNNSVYDLLEETTIHKTLQSKIIREDATHNMFVHGVTELEVKNVDEAIEAFQIGQKRKRMGHTILNAESSRSHSVFTIRLVQAPTDSQGETVVQNKATITVSQLSLVDLAGSERTNRTKNTGSRLREAGNINNSLMTLRTCLEVLRENQMTGASKKVPYRESKVTHLFKNYFDGEGVVRMIVCVNPRAEDYDENIQVMRFAEMTQEVQIPRPTPMRTHLQDDVGYTPGRRKANQLFKLAVTNLEANGYYDAKKVDIDLGLVYSLGPNFPDFNVKNPQTSPIIKELMELLVQRIDKRRLLVNDLGARQLQFRQQLLQMEKETVATRTENESLRTVLGQERQKSTALENRIIIHESSIDELNRKLRDRDEHIRELQRKLTEKQNMLSRKEIESERDRKKFTSKMNMEKEMKNRELDMLLREQKQKMTEQMRLKDERLRAVSQIINADAETLRNKHFNTPTENVETTPSVSHLASMYTPRTPKGVPVANIRHRRSKSTGDRWLEHRAPHPVPLGTIFQPYYKTGRKSITKCELKDVVNSKTSKYCLVSQQADTDGELETMLYKADVIPTTGGGAQVVFNDVECLKQTSPSGSPTRKRPSRSAPASPMETVSKCSVGIEGHNIYKKPRM